MKTAEEVLRPYMPIINNRHRSKTDIRETIIHIMEEYANERLQELSLTDEDIEKEFPSEVGQSVIMERDMTYDDVRKANFYRKQGAKWARNKLTGK